MRDRLPRVALRVAAALLPLALGAGTAQAHTYTLMTDRALLQRADAVVIGVVRSVNERAGGPRRASTVYAVEVTRRLAGRAPDQLLLRTLGGVLADGRRLVVDAEPVLAVGDELLLFLRLDRRGGARLVEFALGAFRIDRSGGRAVADRRLPPPIRLADEAGRLGGHDWEAARDLERFAAWIGRQAVSARPIEPDYLLQDRPDHIVLPYSLFTVGGAALRWRDLSMTFRTTGSLPGDPGGGVTSANGAAGAWNSQSNLGIGIASGGGGNQGFNFSDDINSIVFEDPADEIDGSYDCGSGGTLAVGGPWYAGNTYSAGGETFVEILEGDVVVQDGIGCLIPGDPAMPEELLGHELGHAIGIAHTSVGQALMYPYIHADGRGASLHGDDLDALVALRYRDSGGGGGGGDDPDDPTPDPPDVPDTPDDPDAPPPTIELPGAPRNVGVQVGCSNVVIRWDPPNAGGPVADYVVEIGTRSGGADELAAATDGREYGLTQGGPGTFYARVRARNVTGEGPASNESMYEVDAVPPGVPGTPEIVRPWRRANLAFPPLQWQHVCGAARYEVQVEDSEGNALFAAGPQSFEVCDGMGSCFLERQADTVGPLPNGVYRWGVRARNPEGWSDWSRKTFRVQRQRKPKRAKLTGPRNGAGINGRVELSWKVDEVTNLMLLTMRHRPSGQLTEMRLSPLQYCPTLTTCGVRFTDELAAGSWEWWVIPARDGKTNGKASLHRVFDLAATASTGPGVTVPSPAPLHGPPGFPPTTGPDSGH